MGHVNSRCEKSESEIWRGTNRREDQSGRRPWQLQRNNKVQVVVQHIQAPNNSAGTRGASAGEQFGLVVAVTVQLSNDSVAVGTTKGHSGNNNVVVEGNAQQQKCLKTQVGNMGVLMCAS